MTASRQLVCNARFLPRHPHPPPTFLATLTLPPLAQPPTALPRGQPSLSLWSWVPGWAAQQWAAELHNAWWIFVYSQLEGQARATAGDGQCQACIPGRRCGSQASAAQSRASVQALGHDDLPLQSLSWLSYCLLNHHPLQAVLPLLIQLSRRRQWRFRKSTA